MGDTMRDLRYVMDLEGYLEQTPGKHVIMTGTFDPPHVKHTAPIVMSYEDLLSQGITNPFIIIAHSRNKKKTPVARLSERQDWVLDTFDFFTEIGHRVKVCIDPEMTGPEGKYIYGLRDELQRRLIRVAGRDKEAEMQPGKIETRYVDREEEMMSSSRIRALMRETITHPTIRENLAPKVHKEVMERGYYMDPSKLARAREIAGRE